jgi:hypothetical protein
VIGGCSPKQKIDIESQRHVHKVYILTECVNMEDLDHDEAPTGFRSQWIMPDLLRSWRDCTREMAWLLT